MYGEINEGFLKLLGKEHKFYGVDNECFKLGNQVFEALEDENDGYRSYLGSVEVRDTEGLIFFRRKLATVKLVEWYGGYSFEGYALVDVEDDHVWLRFGTENTDDYYPYFVFEYQPKKA